MSSSRLLLAFAVSACASVCLPTFGCTQTIVEQAAPGDAGTSAGDDGGAPGDDDGGTDAAPDAHVPVAPRCTTPRPPDAQPDPGTPNAFFTAHPLPQLQNNGGPILASPRLVPVFFADDPMADALEDFVASVGCTDYWRQSVGEYGVGDAIATPAVRLTEKAPTSLADTALETWLSKKLTAAGTPFPKPTKDTLYVLFYPETTVITEGGGTSCKEFGGYHTDITLPDGTDVAYAAIPRCPDFAQLPVDQSVTGAASHEIIEAATDPYNKATPAYAFPDDAHLAWALVMGGESADMCTQEQDAFFQPTGYPFTVQRNWSNAAARAGGYPCRPKDSLPYFTAAPKLTDTVNFLGQSGVQGVQVPVGGSKTIDVDLYSEAAGATIQVEAIDASGALAGVTGGGGGGVGGGGSGVGHSAYAFDRTYGASGDTVHLTITTPAGSPTDSEIFVIYAWVGGRYRAAWAAPVGH